MTVFKAVDQSTIYDVCLNTYGTLDLLGKLMTDNNFPGVETYPYAGQEFIFDETLVANQLVYRTNLLGNKKYATRRAVTDISDIAGEFFISTFADGNEVVVWTLYFDGPFELTVDWGDGVVADYVDTGLIVLEHTYANDSERTVEARLSTPAIQNLLAIQLSEGQCQVNGIRGLENVINLLALDLSSNKLETFDPVKPLPSTIIEILLAYNLITSFNPTQKLPANLANLDITNNIVTSFDNQHDAFNDGLLDLKLDNNQLEEFNPSVALPASIRFITIANNALLTFNPSTPLPAGLIALSLVGNLLQEVICDQFPAGLEDFEVRANELTVSGVNALLQDLDGLGYSNANISMETQSPAAAPTGAGITAKNNLIGRGCTVTTD